MIACTHAPNPSESFFALGDRSCEKVEFSIVESVRILLLADDVLNEY
jgi:hypothetical protein